MIRSAVRDLVGRAVIQALVTAVFLAPLAMVGLGSPPAPPAFVPARDELDGDPYGDARFLDLPVQAEPVVAAEDEDAATDAAVDPTPEPVLAPRADGATAGGSAHRPVAEGGPRPAGEAEAGEGSGRGAARGPGAAGHPRPGHAAKGRKKVCDKPNPNIHQGADGVVEIDRALVDYYTQNLESFMSLGYSHPYDEGDVHGWYVSGFSCTSPVSKAGFQRGDVLLAVNGKKTRSWVGVFMLYQKLKNKDDFEVELVRKGHPTTLRFRVVEGGPFEPPRQG